MQHSSADLENYARLYHADRMREAVARRRVSEVATGSSWLAAKLQAVRGLFSVRVVVEPVASPASVMPVVDVPAAPLVSLATARPAASDAYADMIVLVRGPRRDAA